MVPKMQIIGSLKLAKIQCCTWGVPVTTGFKNMDYFFSGESMETDFSQEHYSEKLIKLPACSVDYDIPKKEDMDDSKYKKTDSHLISEGLDMGNFKNLRFIIQLNIDSILLLFCTKRETFPKSC